MSSRKTTIGGIAALLGAAVMALRAASSRKTTIGGIAVLLGAAVMVLRAVASKDGIASLDWGAMIASVSAGIALIKARDNDVTSEQAGAK